MSNPITTTLELIPPDAIVNMKISGAFYMRLRSVLSSMIDTNNLEEANKMLEELKTRQPKTQEEFNIVTMLTLVLTFEEELRKQKGMTKQTVKVEGDQVNILNTESPGDAPES